MVERLHPWKPVHVLVVLLPTSPEGPMTEDVKDLAMKRDDEDAAARLYELAVHMGHSQDYADRMSPEEQGGALAMIFDGLQDALVAAREERDKIELALATSQGLVATLRDERDEWRGMEDERTKELQSACADLKAAEAREAALRARRDEVEAAAWKVTPFARALQREGHDRLYAVIVALEDALSRPCELTRPSERAAPELPPSQPREWVAPVVSLPGDGGSPPRVEGQSRVGPMPVKTPKEDRLTPIRALPLAPSAEEPKE